MCESQKMKVLVVLLSVVALLVSLPLLHAWVAFLSIDGLSQDPTIKSFFYLFTIPAWALAIMVFAVETYRRGFIPSTSRVSNTLMLGLLGMFAPAIGLALSPVAGNLGLMAFVMIALCGFFVGLLGAVLFNSTTALLGRSGGT